MGDLFDYLMSGRAEKSSSAEELRQFGQKAAQAYAQDGTPLNDTIVQLAKQASLSDEKVRRVVEFANKATNAQKLREPYDGNVSFPVADSSVVLQRMQQGAVKTAAPRQLATPARYNPAAAFYSVEAHLGSMSKTAGLRHMEKLAQPTGRTRTDEYGDVRDLTGVTIEYRGAREAFGRAKDSLVVAEQQMLAKLASLSRVTLAAVSGGESPYAISAAVQLANPSTELYEIVATELGDSFRHCGLQKIAAMGYEVDDQNPITGLIQDLMGLSQKLVAADELVQRTKQQVDELTQFLQGPGSQGPTDQLFADEAPNIAMQQMVQQQQAAQQAAQQPQGPPGQPGQPQGQPGQPPQGA